VIIAIVGESIFCHAEIVENQSSVAVQLALFFCDAGFPVGDEVNSAEGEAT
jgi:hypothetical protein